MQSTDDKTHRNAVHAGTGRRRGLRALGAAALGLALARTVPATAGPLRLAFDVDLSGSGVAQALARGFARDTGLALELIALDAQAALEEAESGRCDAVLSASPLRASALLAQGLLHDPRTVARLRWLLVGPRRAAADGAGNGPDSVRSGVARPGAAGPGSVALSGPLSTDVIASLQALAADTAADRLFLLPAGPAATGDLAGALWRQAGLDAHPPWVQSIGGNPVPLAEQARQRAAWALVGAWSLPAADPPRGSVGQRPAKPGADAGAAAWGRVVDHDPRLTVALQWLRSFRSRHPAARLFADWATGPSARRSLARLPGVVAGDAKAPARGPA